MSYSLQVRTVRAQSRNKHNVSFSQIPLLVYALTQVHVLHTYDLDDFLLKATVQQASCSLQSPGAGMVLAGQYFGWLLRNPH